MASSLLTLNEIKSALDVEHDDHNDLLLSEVDAAQWQAFQYIGIHWKNATDALPVIREAMIAYVRELYNGNPEALLTDPTRSHLFYRLLKPLANIEPPNAPITDLGTKQPVINIFEGGAVDETALTGTLSKVFVGRTKADGTFDANNHEEVAVPPSRVLTLPPVEEKGQFPYVLTPPQVALSRSFGSNGPMIEADTAYSMIGYVREINFGDVDFFVPAVTGGSIYRVDADHLVGYIAKVKLAPFVVSQPFNTYVEDAAGILVPGSERVFKSSTGLLQIVSPRSVDLSVLKPGFSVVFEFPESRRAHRLDMVGRVNYTYGAGNVAGVLGILIDGEPGVFTKTYNVDDIPTYIGVVNNKRQHKFTILDDWASRVPQDRRNNLVMPATVSQFLMSFETFASNV